MSTVEIMAKSAGAAATRQVGSRLETSDSVAASSVAASNGSIVQLESVRRAFGSVAALDGVNLDVTRGEIFGIIGRSGAGKSTLIRTINALERIDEGRVIVEGRDLSALDESELNFVRRRIGMIFQHFNLLSMKTVFENVELPLKLAGQAKDVRAQAVWQMLDLVGLRDKAAVYPTKLSGGQKQRVGIARALVTRPTLLLSDEATSALDPETTLSILRLLKELKGTLGVTIVLITHEMSVIREICDRVAVVDQGKVVEQGEVWDVFAHPQTDLTRRLLRTVRPPLPDALLNSLRQQPLPGGRTLLRVSSSETDQYQAIMALLAEPEWQTRIAHAEVNRIAGHSVGTVTFAVRDRSESALHEILAAAERKQIDIEVLGHVAE
jgi:D-methionine transport system ATP-binding protein